MKTLGKIIIAVFAICALLAVDHWVGPHLVSGGGPADDLGQSLFELDDETLVQNEETGLYTNETAHAKKVGVRGDKVIYKLVSDIEKPELKQGQTQNLSQDQSSQAQFEGQSQQDQSQKSSGKVIKTSIFEDWVDGELNLKDTDITEFQVFNNKKAAETFVEEYRWNEKHDFQWNIDEMAIQFANVYGESDPAPSIFATTGSNSNIYFVTLSDDGITPEFYQLDSAKDNRAELIEKKSGEKTVYPVDQWETEDL